MTSDEGLHGIQLNGKQLVFLFMAGTVVFVVIFLCGVLVGRGVRGRVELTEVTAQAAANPTASATATRDTTAPDSRTPDSRTLSRNSPPSATASTNGAGGASQEILTYPDRLGDDGIAPETLVEPIDPTAIARKPSRAVTPPAAAVPPKPAVTPRSADPVRPEPARPTSSRSSEAAASATATPAATAPAPAAPVAAPREPAGNGFVVQVAAVRERAEADTIARRLLSKGYPSFVTTSGAAGPRVFRVRVGKYGDRRAAETVKSRLEKEEQFKPWITK